MAEKVDYAALKNGGFMRQKQKGCFSLRIAVVGGNLTAENIKTVAEVAEKYGHGYVHMTSRQGIEIPFIKVEDINVVKEGKPCQLYLPDRRMLYLPFCISLPILCMHPESLF